jgi:hypothetical protein
MCTLTTVIPIFSKSIQLTGDRGGAGG